MLSMRKKKTYDSFDPASVRFCGGSKMFVGDYEVFFVCCALMAGIKGIESIPLRKRSIFHNFMLVEWQKLLASQSEWMQRLEDFQNGD